ncbi:MipA/OmpV family protein [Pseudomonas sp. NFIX28]|uniref:MipA/OmpV family protein n=1 Tax=Pseudomonas sp. NFIX28 TaxID=1566235 RepID=UPI000B8923C8|nr:MipA/OmpV family protein [Pseudomonas sp. NFIX28]
MRLSFSALALIATSFSIMAEDRPFTVGLGVASQSKLYKDMDAGSKLVPLLNGRSGNFWVEGLQAGYDLYEQGDFSIGAALQYNPSGFKTSDAKSSSRLYDGLKDRDSALEGGLVLRYDLGWAEMKGALMTDISAAHKGQSVELGLSRTLSLSPTWRVTPEATTTWVSAKQNDYYFGVDPSASNALRDSYSAGSGVNYGVAVNSHWQMSDHWHLLGRMAMERFSGSVKDSPLTEKGHQSTVMLGLGYSF